MMADIKLFRVGTKIKESFEKGSLRDMTKIGHSGTDNA